MYREPVPPDAANAVIENDTRVSIAQVQAAIGALLAQHLLDARGEGCYQPHAIVAEYVRGHLVEGNEQANRQTLLEAQSKAALTSIKCGKTHILTYVCFPTRSSYLRQVSLQADPSIPILTLAMPAAIALATPFFIYHRIAPALRTQIACYTQVT